MFSEIVEGPEGLLLRGGLQDLLQHLVHLVAVVGGHLVEDVSPEVRLTSLPDRARKGLLQGLLEPLVRIDGCQLHAGEAPPDL